jgi:hypothetical protein
MAIAATVRALAGEVIDAFVAYDGLELRLRGRAP